MDLDTFFESSSYGQLFIEGAIRSDNLEHVLPKEPSPNILFAPVYKGLGSHGEGHGLELK